MIQSVDRALSILEYMSRRKSVGVSEVAAEFGLDKGTVSRIMQTFEKHGIVAKNDGNLKYRIGSGTLQLSHNILMCNRMVRTARPALMELVEELGTTARLCMIEGKKVFIIDQVEMRKGKPIRDADIPGMSKPLYCSAIGKIMMAYMPQKKQDALLDKLDWVPFTENTIVDKETLKRELLEIRRQNFALNVAEFSDRAYCIAVAIFAEGKKEPKYCIGVTGSKDYRENPAQFARIVKYMQDASQYIRTSIETDALSFEFD